MSLCDSFPIVRQNVPLSVYTRLQLGGTAEYFAEPENENELAELLRYCHGEGIPVRVLGAGSNLLVPEAGMSGLVINLSKPDFCRITLDGLRLTAGAGAVFGQVITHAVSQGLGGIEASVGMPGSFGGAICGNTGTIHGGDLGQWVENVRVIDFSGKIAMLLKSEITFAYRYSSLEDVIILSATLCLEKDNPTELAKRMRKLWIVRKAQQPMGESASVLAFKNPETGLTASELIDQASLKGTRIGGAYICERNASFIIVDEECSSDDVLQLIRLVQDKVGQQTEIELEPAIKIW